MNEVNFHVLYALASTVYLLSPPSANDDDRFTKPVAVSGDVGLFLATGSRGARADYFSGGNGTYDVVFR